MALIIADRVKETSTTNGAGNITLSGAVTGFQSFNSAIGVGNTCYYVIENLTAGEWEVGIGTLSGATTLLRTTILKSSNSNNAVAFTSGTKNVFVSFPADEINGLATLNDIESVNDKIESAGVAWLWGRNYDGQLGDNTTVDNASPAQLITGGNNWNQASCGFKHTAAVKTDGTLWTWGKNENGQLGDNTTDSKSSPVQTIVGGNNWKQVSIGRLNNTVHTAAVKTDGTLWTWGSNIFGELGDDTTVNKSSPVQVITGGANWKQVSCGQNFTAAVKADGTLWAWGKNGYGQLGDNTIASKSSPVQLLTGGNDWEQVSCGYIHTAAIKTDGTLWLWGGNPYGQLGENTTVRKSSPVQTVAGGNNWKQVSCSRRHTAAVKADGTLWTWGLNNFGALGDNTTANKSSPVQTVTGGYKWKQVSCGHEATAAVKTDGTLWTWGYNYIGVLGDNTTADKSSPVQTVTGGYKWKSVSIGEHALAIAADVISGDQGGTGVANTDKTITIGGNFTTSGAFDTILTVTANTSVILPTEGTLATLDGSESFTNKTMSTNTTWNGNVIPGQYGGTGIANTGFTLTMAGNVTHAGAFARTLTATGTTSVTLPTTGTLATLAGIESFTNKTLSTNTTWNGNVIPGQYGGTGIANTGRTITIGGNFTTSGAFTTTLTSTANTSVTLPTTGTLATLAGAETLSSKVVNLVAGTASTGPLRFTSGTNMTTAAAGNMEFNGTRLFFTPSTTRQTVAFLTDITGGLTVADDTTTAATRYLIFTNATSGSVSTANTSSSKLFFNPATGDLTAGGSITALSDRTLKNNITTITGAIDKVNSLRGVEFDWVDSGDHSVGVIAQEVEDVIPEVVLTHKGLKSVAYGNLIAVLIEAIKDQDKRIKLLEALVERLVK